MELVDTESVEVVSFCIGCGTSLNENINFPNEKCIFSDCLQFCCKKRIDHDSGNRCQACYEKKSVLAIEDSVSSPHHFQPFPEPLISQIEFVKSHWNEMMYALRRYQSANQILRAQIEKQEELLQIARHELSELQGHISNCFSLEIRGISIGKPSLIPAQHTQHTIMQNSATGIIQEIRSINEAYNQQARKYVKTSDSTNPTADTISSDDTYSGFISARKLTNLVGSNAKTPKKRIGLIASTPIRKALQNGKRGSTLIRNTTPRTTEKKQIHRSLKTTGRVSTFFPR